MAFRHLAQSSIQSSRGGASGGGFRVPLAQGGGGPVKPRFQGFGHVVVRSCRVVAPAPWQRLEL